jgi:hypothetical protein
MRTFGLILAIVAAQQGLSQERSGGAPKTVPSDLLIREACVRWFMPQRFHSEQPVSHRNPKWKNILLSQDKRALAQRLEIIRSGKLHYIEYSSISFVLAYIGHEPAANTRRMLATIDLNQERPPNTYGWLVGEPKAFGHDDIIKGFGDSTFQLFEHNPRHDVLAELLRFGSDGESSYFKSWLVKQLFLKYPSAVLRVGSETGYLSAVGMHLAFEANPPIINQTRVTLRVMKQDGRADIRRAAHKISDIFEWHLE